MSTPAAQAGFQRSVRAHQPAATPAPARVATPAPFTAAFRHAPSSFSKLLPPAAYTLAGSAVAAGLGALVTHRLGHGALLGAGIGSALGAIAGYGTYRAVTDLLPNIDHAALLPYVWGLYGHETDGNPADDPRVQAARSARTRIWGVGLAGSSVLGAAAGAFVGWLAHRNPLKGATIGAVAGAGLGAAAIKGLSMSLQGLTDGPAIDPTAGDPAAATRPRGGPPPTAAGPPLTPVDPHAPAAPGDMSLGDHFFMGTTTSATQVEGGGIDNDITRWAKDHRGWAAANPGLDHWNRIDQDYQHLAGNGHNAHGLTLDWSRIEPEEGVFDQAAIEHYRQEIETCRRDGMEPMVTLMQYALPPWLADKGGVLAPDAAKQFAKFARVCAEQFGDQVTWWNTMNEPNTLAGAAYLAGIWSPGVKSPIAMARAMDAQLHMHAAAANELHKVAKERGRDARVGVVHIDDRAYPYQDWNPADQLASGLYDYMGNRWFLDSIAAGKSLSPIGDGKPIKGLKDSLDYVGLNFYGRDWGHLGSSGYEGKGNPDAPAADDAFDVDGMYEMILSVYNQLHVPVMITESGVNIPDPDPNNVRGRAIVDSLAAIHHAQQDGVPVLGYLHWTDWDSPEWQDGWTQHYGLFGFDPQTGARWDRPAAATFEAIARKHAIPQQWLSADDRQSPATRDSHAAHERDMLLHGQD